MAIANSLLFIVDCEDEGVLILPIPIGSSLYLNGVMNTAKALATGNKRAKITADDLGLVNQVSAELNNLNGMTKFLDFALTYSIPISSANFLRCPDLNGLIAGCRCSEFVRA